MDLEGTVSLLAKQHRENVALSNALREAQQIIAQRDQEISQLEEQLLNQELTQDA